MDRIVAVLKQAELDVRIELVSRRKPFDFLAVLGCVQSQNPARV